MFLDFNQLKMPIDLEIKVPENDPQAAMKLKKDIIAVKIAANVSTARDVLKAKNLITNKSAFR